MATKPKNKRKAAQAAKGTSKSSRRSFLAYAPYIIGGVLIVGAFGFFTIRSDLAEQDLSVIGNGTPTIVQVNQPDCPSCIALQRETRAALSNLDDSDINYRVANLGTRAGLDFATQHAASFTTLLLFDGKGEITRRIRGETPRNMLRVAFMAHLAAEAEN